MPTFLPPALLRWTLALGLLCPRLASEEASLPEPKALLERVIEATKALESARSSYTYMEESIERKLDSRGNAKETTVQTFEVTRVPGGEVRRLISENGQPLSAEKAQAEEVKVQAKLKELLEPKEPKKEKKKDKDEEFTLSDMLTVLEVSKLERSTVEGRSVISMEMRPRKGAKTSGLSQRLASKLEARILVDEASSQVVKGEGRLLDSCWVGWGIFGSLAPPTAFTFEQAQVGEGVWMPVSGTFTVHARVVVVPVHMEMSFRCWDFKRFVVEDAVGEPEGGPVKVGA